ncbi:MAG: outer membrane beta-barrel protein [Candidatus Sulfotelmatobacter sp.]
MIRKFASTSAWPLLALTFLLGAVGFSQSTPAAQAPATPPAAQQPAAAQTPAPTAQQPNNGQEPAEEESTSRRKKHDFRNWDFNAGAGANTDSGATHRYVREGGFVASAGVARNANKYLGLRADLIYADLPLRDSTQELAQATGATSYALSLTLGPIINFQVTKLYSGYLLFGPSYIHREGSLNGDIAVPGSACNGFWTWWGRCQNASIPLSGNFVNSSVNQYGYFFGAGVARKMPSGVEIYAEYRLMHGSGDYTTTDFRPITIGFRW